MKQQKRKSKKGIILKAGEYQRANGSYEYKYMDCYGKRHSLYAKTLEDLREKEKKAQVDIWDGINVDGSKITVADLVKRYLSQKTGVRHNTEAAYRTITKTIENEPLGCRPINSVKLSDAKAFFIKLQRENGKGYSSLHAIRGVLRPAFQLAVDDDLIRKNPFQFPLSTVVINDSTKREAITEEQEQIFLDFVKNDKHFSRYYEGIYILFKTGLRISEFVGLTEKDIDFENRLLTIDHQLQRKRDGTYLIVATKTNAGTRTLPLTDDVLECFRKIIEKRPVPKHEPTVDGMKGFLYLDKNENPMIALHWEHFFKHIRQKYDKKHDEPLPVITPHVCRHTYCSNMAKSGINPKALQYLMGHSDIGVTLNTYTHIGLDGARSELLRLSQATEPVKGMEKTA